jgi:hypothetical protein
MEGMCSLCRLIVMWFAGWCGGDESDASRFSGMLLLVLKQTPAQKWLMCVNCECHIDRGRGRDGGAMCWCPAMMGGSWLGCCWWWRCCGIMVVLIFGKIDKKSKTLLWDPRSGRSNHFMSKSAVLLVIGNIVLHLPQSAQICWDLLHQIKQDSAMRCWKHYYNSSSCSALMIGGWPSSIHWQQLG